MRETGADHVHGLRLQRGGGRGLPNHRFAAGTVDSDDYQFFCTLQRPFCAATQRETKRLPDADAEEKTELILPFQDDGWGAKIKSYRKKHGLTQKKLAAQIGVKHFTLQP